ncbi:MAG: alanine--glyoxylate aminotransferase family protein [Candidatus Marinimicrobia bacterium]|nr:alanine--glyoxylate aminotransferase family protein [Candidatus Neomarinimicrobiota bacterium]MBL7068002.1 alanine--glyoxylate aminotransferase family protein [Candidatus Neomarinimicrobiota bacterium]
MHKKLFIPGPVDVRPEVLEAMSAPMIGHRTKDASALGERICKNLQKLFYTDNPILLSTTSGTGLMEGSIRSLTTKRAVVFSIGAFGNRWAKLAKSNNVPVDKVEAEWGQPTLPEIVDEYLATGKYDVFTITHNETSTGVMNPVEEIAEIRKKYPDILWLMDAVSSMAGVMIEVDKLGVDVCITSTQKALGLPPGLSVCSISQKAIDQGRKVEFRGTYLDVIALYDYMQKKAYQYPSTPSLSHMFALNKQLDYILNEEGLDNRYARHLEMAKITRAWANEHFEQFAAKGYESNTLTTINNTKGISVADLNKRIGELGYMISNGYGDLKEKTFRIAHMADRTVDVLKELLDVLDVEIKKM